MVVLTTTFRTAVLVTCRAMETTPLTTRLDSGWVWMISATDYRDHAVTDAATEAGVTAGLDHFPAVCGHTVIVCSMYEPPGPTCRACRERLVVASRTQRRRSRRGPWWLW